MTPTLNLFQLTQVQRTLFVMGNRRDSYKRANSATKDKETSEPANTDTKDEGQNDRKLLFSSVKLRLLDWFRVNFLKYLFF